RWPLSELPPNFNYHQIDGLLADNGDVMFAMLPFAFHADAAGQAYLNTDLLESAELTSENPQTITYRINPAATWDDGTPITVEDFRAQWQALSGTNPAFQAASNNGYNQIASVEQGADEREAIVTYSAPFADWESLFSPLYPASTNSDPNVFNSGWTEEPQVTGGPFRFDSIDRTAQTITLVRNENYWGDKAKLDRIIYRVIDLDAQVDALANDEIDFLDVGPDVNNFQRAQMIQGVEVRTAGGPNFRHLTMNGTSSVLQDVNVRLALSMAINRQAITQAMIGPLGAPPEPLGNHIFMANQEGYVDNGSEVVPYDPERARQMLETAGWTLEGETRRKDGQELVIRMVIPSGVSTSQQEAELVQGMLAEVGARVNIEVVPLTDFFESYVTPGNFDFTVFSWIGTPYPISSSRSIYVSPEQGPEGLVIEQNYARVGSPEIDQLFDEATAELDPQRAIEIANEIDRKIWEIGHSLTNYQRPDIIAVKSNVANFGAMGFASVIYEDIGYAQA
ncbi:MAG TPA: ABC transporter family substrate-binding protein, partial [Actinomycetota bacterium]|nr:ABC transporter family substrate-binding protein [Actinomycetota bacterium]